MQRGEIHRFWFDPSTGTAANKARPAVIVSNNAVNVAIARRGQGVITVVPLTTNISTVYPFQVLLHADDTGLPHDSKAQVEQIRAFDITRHVEHLGEVSTRDMALIDRALLLHLRLSG